MNDFVFENSTKVYFGAGCVGKHLPALLDDYGPNVLLVYGGGSVKKNGAYDAVVKALADAGKTVTEFGGVPANPTYSLVLKGAAIAKEKNIDFILAAGGGSVMDCAKAVSMAARCSGDAWQRFWANRGVVGFEPIPLGVIVTVCGTGSEVNGGAVITNEAEKVKTDRDYPACNPRFALLDPTYTYTVPQAQLAASGFDILSHIMETYFSEPDEENVSDDVSEALMRGVLRDLRASMLDPRDYNARGNLMWESSMAENRIIKLGKKLDFQCHQIEHQMSAFTNCGHGKGLAVIHPVCYRHIYKYGLKKFVRFAQRVWNVDGAGKSQEETALAGVEALASFIMELGLPTTLRELGLTDKSLLKKIADSTNITPGCCKQMTSGEILEILEECW
jgi:alcohol dehydrogenase YqhD (iron-dependent ADH family)